MQQSLIDVFLLIDDPQERLAALVDRARRTPPLPPVLRTDAHRVRGCTSAVWLDATLVDNRCRFRADADSPLVRGLVVFLADFFNDTSPAELAAVDLDPLADLQLTKNLSPTRLHGLAAVRATIRAFAQAQLTPPAASP